MNGFGVVYLGSRYLRRKRARIVLLVAAFTLVWLLPAGVAVVVKEFETQLRARSIETPLILGATGSPLELVFNALYFTQPEVPTMPVSEVTKMQESELVEAIPIDARFSASGFRIVGTTIDYFAFRGLEIAEGRSLLRLGDCVVGANVARELGVGPDDAVISSPETLFDLAGVYPLKMKVCGVLAATGTPDDDAVFVDLKTNWIIEGRGHGHVEAAETAETERLASVDGEIRLNAAVVEYNEITPETAGSFHFHGDVESYPVTAAIVIPNDAKSQALIRGRYEVGESVHLISPVAEMDQLFATVFTVQKFVLALLILIGIATLGLGVFVFLLSYRLRESEFRHLRELGADLGTIRALVAFEAGFVICASALLAIAVLSILRLGVESIVSLVV